MGRQSILNQINNSIKAVRELPFDEFRESPGGTYQPWNGMDLEDFEKSFESMLTTLEGVEDQAFLQMLPWNILNGFQKALGNVSTQSQQFFQKKDQQTFQNAFQHVESLRTSLQTWGINYLIFTGTDLEEKADQLRSEVQKLVQHNHDVEALKSNVRELIEPAVAGSLSKSFSDRKTELHGNQIRWFWASCVAAVIGVIVTIWVVASVVGIFTNDLVRDMLAEANRQNTSSILWTTVALRLAVLPPLYAIFAFAFAQYRKERNLEEEYAHRAAVATSLPNYGDLAVDNTVKDQILSEASGVIFSSPLEGRRSDPRDDTPALEEVNKLIGGLNRLTPKASKGES